MLVAGVVEGVATAAIYGFIKKTAPSIIVGPEAVDGQLAADGTAKKTSLIPTLILVAVLVVATPLGLLAPETPGASGTPRAPQLPFRRLATTACSFGRPRYSDLCRRAAHG